MTHHDLTDRQRELVDFIREWKRSRGYAPTMSEAARHLGVTRGRARQIAVVLEHRGILTHDAGTQRTWRLARR